MTTLPAKIARVFIKDVIWLGLFFVVAQWHALAGALTTRNAFYAAGLFLAAYSIFQLAVCVSAYLASYRGTIAAAAPKD